MRNLPTLSWTIRTRIGIAIVATATAALVVMAVAVYLIVRSTVYANFDDSVRARAASNVSLVDLSGLQPKLRSSATQLKSGEDIGFVRLYDAAGNMLGEDSPTIAVTPDEARLAAEAASDGRVLSTVRIGDSEFRLLALQIGQDGASPVVLVTGVRRTSIDETLDVLETTLLIAVPLTSLLLGIAAFVIARRALKPVHEITATARSIAEGDLEQRIGSVAARDEVGELADTFNSMIERLSETIERERRFTGDASHELRTPLTAMAAAAEVTLSQERTPDEYRSVIGTFRTKTAQMTHTVRQLLMLSRLDVGATAPQFIEIEVSELLEAVVASFAESHSGVEVDLSASQNDLLVLGDAELLAHAIMNVLENSAVHGGPAVAISIEVKLADDGAVALRLKDNGPGIDPSLLPRVFERFHRGASSSNKEGAGLGLALVSSIARLHGGSVSISSDAGGTEVRFVFPAYVRQDSAPRPIHLPLR